MSDLANSLFGTIFNIVGVLLHALVVVFHSLINIAVVVFLLYGLYRLSKYLIGEYRIKRRPVHPEAAPKDEQKNSPE